MKNHSVGTRKEREYLARRSDILRAAEKLFAEKGFYGATMSDLAVLSEFSIGTLYNFFKGKEEVYYTLILEKLDLFQLRLGTEVNQHSAGLDQILALIKASFVFFQENKDFFNIFIQERAAIELSVGQAAGEELRKKYLAYIGFVARVIARGIERGDIRKLNSRELAYSLVGMMNSFIFYWTLYPQSSELTSKAPFIYDLFLKGAAKREEKEVV